MPVELVMLSNHLILCRPLLLPSIFPTIRVFSNKFVLSIKWPKCWSFSISPSNEYLDLISFGMDWFDLLAAQGTHKSLLKHQNSKEVDLKLSIQKTKIMATGSITSWEINGKALETMSDCILGAPKSL